MAEPWILDTDVTVKPLYGHQEGAVAGYNPRKPGRASHTYHTYFIANLRLVFDAEVQAGNKTASKHSSPGLWELLGRIPRAHWPAFIRGDRDWGTQANRARAEQEGIVYEYAVPVTSPYRAWSRCSITTWSPSRIPTSHIESPTTCTTQQGSSVRR